MKDRRFWLAVVSAFIATQHNTGEAALAVTTTDLKHSVKTQASMVEEEEAIVALFEADDHEQVIKTAGALWPQLETMPERVLYCLSESSIRIGKVETAKNGFELLVARNPQNHSYRAGLAYTQLYGGELEKGLSTYRQVLLESQGMLKVAAEDAVALLSQGNIGGGKELFKMVIEISPDRQHYIQWYERSLQMYRIAGDSSVFQGQVRTATLQNRVPEKNESKMLHTQAVELAREGQYQQSLEIIDQLFKANPKDETIVADYIAILQWAGQNGQAIRLYEQQQSTDFPLYVVRSVSSAYFSLKNYNKALEVLQPAINQGERDALLRAGEMHLLRGDNTGAQVYYERLFAQNPSDYEAYLSRGLLSVQAKDYRQAITDLERVRIMMPDGPDKATDLRKVEHNLARAYMNVGQNQKAATLLEGYTKTLPVEGAIADDYVIALAASFKHELAVKEGERLWPKYTEAPVLGLKSLAESYIVLGQQEQALAIHQQLADRQSGGGDGEEEGDAPRKLAFQLMLNGHTTEGIGHYTQILGQSMANGDRVVEDAVTFINTDKYVPGKMLFELVLAKYPKSAYRKLYADSLAKKQLSHSAYRQYQLLSVKPEGELAGLSGMVRTAITMGDYKKSRESLDRITKKYGRSKGVAALATISSDDWQAGNEKSSYTLAGNYQGKNSKVLSTAETRGKQGETVSTSNRKAKEKFTYEMNQFATKFLAAPETNAEIFKIEFAYAISNITAKVMPMIPRDQRNGFAYEMAQITSNVINDQNLNIKDSKTQFTQITTTVLNYIDKITDADEKTVSLKKTESPEDKLATSPNELNQETYAALIDGLLEVGNRSKNIDSKVNIDGEIRLHYASNSGSTQYQKDTSGLRTYIGADSRISKDWHAYTMVEGQKSFLNYNNKFELTRWYVVGKTGATTVKAGLFGYNMAEGNIYDSGFRGTRFDFGDIVKYTLSYGETNDTQATYIASAKYNDFDYSLEAGVYHYKLDTGTYNQNTIWTASGIYKFNNFSVGSMYLRSSQKDVQGNNNGYVFSLDYGELKSYRPGTYSIFAKYYNQAKGTYIAHGMNGDGNAMDGMKGYGLGMNYTLAKDVVAGIEYYDVTDKISKEKGKTLWGQVTYYF